MVHSHSVRKETTSKLRFYILPVTSKEIRVTSRKEKNSRFLLDAGVPKVQSPGS